MHDEKRPHATICQAASFVCAFYENVVAGAGSGIASMGPCAHGIRIDGAPDRPYS